VFRRTPNTRSVFGVRKLESCRLSCCVLCVIICDLWRRDGRTDGHGGHSIYRAIASRGKSLHFAFVAAFRLPVVSSGRVSQMCVALCKLRYTNPVLHRRTFSGLRLVDFNSRNSLCGWSRPIGHVGKRWAWVPWALLYGRPIGQAIIFLPCGFYLSSIFFPRLIAAASYFHTCCGSSANLECRSEMYCTRLAGNTGRKISPSGHHCTTLSGYIFATKARIDNWKKTC